MGLLKVKKNAVVLPYVQAHLQLSLLCSLFLPVFVWFEGNGGGRQLRVIWVFALFHWELHCFLTTVWKQARMPHDSMTQPCWFPFLSRSCSHSTTHTGILPAYKQNSHDAKQQTARTACQPLITANKSTSISTPHTICIQNIPLHLSCSRCKLQSFHSKYKGSQWTALWL